MSNSRVSGGGSGGGGSGDVSAAATITNDSIVRGDGGAKGVQDSGLYVEDVAGSDARLHAGGVSDIEINPNKSGFTTVGTGNDVDIDAGAGTVANGGITIAATDAASVAIGRSGILTTISGLTKARLPFVSLLKTSSQNVGGANGTTTAITWQTQSELDSDYFSHDSGTNPERITVAEAGWYNLKATIGATQGGGARTTLQCVYRINGGAAVLTGLGSSYSRGSSYGDLAPQLDVELRLAANDYIEVLTIVEDSDGTYTINTDVASCQVVLRWMAA